MDIAFFQVNMLAESTYVFCDETSSYAIIIDPGTRTPKERESLDIHIDSLGCKEVIVLLTHTHLDHIFGVAHLVERYGAKVYTHKLEEEYLFMNTYLCDSWHIPEPDAFKVDKYIAGGDVLEFGSLSIKVLDVPGHSAGGLAYYIEEEGVVFTGDALFAGSVGRSDFPGGDENLLWQSIRSQLMTLPDNTKVLPGHGSGTIIANERIWIDI